MKKLSFAVLVVAMACSQDPDGVPNDSLRVVAFPKTIGGFIGGARMKAKVQVLNDDRVPRQGIEIDWELIAECSNCASNPVVFLTVR